MAQAEDLVIKIQIPHATRTQLEKSFGPYGDAEEEERVTARFAEMALQVFSDWISGKKRYRTLTEQYIDWIEEIYTELLPSEEAPSVERIYNSLNMPYGQAAYVARVLAAKTLVHWREIATDELRTALNDIKKDASEYIEEGTQEQAIQIEVSEVAVRELLRVCSTRRRADRSYLMPQLGASVAGYRSVLIPSSTIIDLTSNPDW